MCGVAGRTRWSWPRELMNSRASISRLERLPLASQATWEELGRPGLDGALAAGLAGGRQFAAARFGAGLDAHRLQRAVDRRNCSRASVRRLWRCTDAPLETGAGELGADPGPASCSFDSGSSRRRIATGRVAGTREQGRLPAARSMSAISVPRAARRFVTYAVLRPCARDGRPADWGTGQGLARVRPAGRAATVEDRSKPS